LSVPRSHTLVCGLIGALTDPPPFSVTSSVYAFGWQGPLVESPDPGTLGEKRALTTVDAPGASCAPTRTAPLTGLARVGRTEPFAERSWRLEAPAVVQLAVDVFVNFSA
jgi:hypothetical protein